MHLTVSYLKSNDLSWTWVTIDFLCDAITWAFRNHQPPAQRYCCSFQ